MAEVDGGTLSKSNLAAELRGRWLLTAGQERFSGVERQLKLLQLLCGRAVFWKRCSGTDASLLAEVPLQTRGNPTVVSV